MLIYRNLRACASNPFKTASDFASLAVFLYIHCAINEQTFSAAFSHVKELAEDFETFYEDRCNALDRQIDQLVYQLYDLTPDEIKIVENI